MPAGVELVMYALVTIAIVFGTGRRHMARQSRAAAVASLLVLAMPIGQVLRDSRLTYPFDQWGMYGSTKTPPTYFTFELLDAEGRHTDYPFSHLTLWSPGPLAGYSPLNVIAMRLVKRLDACRCESGDSQLDEVIEALVRIHQVRTSRAPVGFRISEHPIAVRRENTVPARQRYVWTSTR